MTAISKNEYNYNFPFNQQGIDESCGQLKKTLEETRSLTKVKICLIYDRIDKTQHQASATFDRDIINKLVFQSLNGLQKEAIRNVFKQLSISINHEENQDGEVIKTPQGGTIVMGDSTSRMGIKGLDLEMLRRLLPNSSDEELLRMFTKST